MVDLGEIQTAYYMVAATGVLVAAAYYMMNMRYTQRNMKQTLDTRQATFENNEWQKCMSLEWCNNYLDLMGMQWTDLDDFKRKYDSSVNPQNFAKRSYLFFGLCSVGSQVRQGLLDTDSFDDMWAMAVLRSWYKFKPIIEAYRGWQWPKGAYRDFEYLAGVLEKKLMDSDPDFMKKMNNVNSPPEAHK